MREAVPTSGYVRLQLVQLTAATPRTRLAASCRALTRSNRAVGDLSRCCVVHASQKDHIDCVEKVLLNRRVRSLSSSHRHLEPLQARSELRAATRGLDSAPSAPVANNSPAPCR